MSAEPEDRLASDAGHGAPVLYDSSRRTPRWIEEATFLWRYRGLVHELVIRDIKVRYKRSVLGMIWTMLAPLLNMIALTLVFSAILKQAIENYPVYFMAGQIFWNYFSQTTSAAASQSQGSNDMAKRTFIPRSVFVAAAVGGGLVNLGLSLIPLVVIIAITGFPLYATWVFLPVAVFITTLFTAGVSLFLFTVTTRFADVREMYNVIVQTWFFLTPIVYHPSIVPLRYRIALWLNPMYYLVQVFRKPIYDGAIPQASLVLVSLGLSAAVLVSGWIYFCRRTDRMAYWS
ncbi:MAG TPA: ABC transporter permease [Thermoanaerobaculia bacterium]|nr:ABC transporter permease [Thermoanaerobaculia bacterium]